VVDVVTSLLVFQAGNEVRIVDLVHLVCSNLNQVSLLWGDEPQRLELEKVTRERDVVIGARKLAPGVLRGGPQHPVEPGFGQLHKGGSVCRQIATIEPGPNIGQELAVGVHTLPSQTLKHLLLGSFSHFLSAFGSLREPSRNI